MSSISNIARIASTQVGCFRRSPSSYIERKAPADAARSRGAASRHRAHHHGAKFLGICGSRGLVLVLCAHVSRSVHLSGKASGGTVEGPLPSPRLRELLEGFSRMAKSLARLILCPALHP